MQKSDTEARREDESAGARPEDRPEAEPLLSKDSGLEVESPSPAVTGPAVTGSPLTGPAAELPEEEELEENEPYLGPAWAAVMLVLWVLKKLFPAAQYSALWWFQMYIIGLVVAITAFTMIKRHQFYRAEEKRLAQKR